MFPGKPRGGSAWILVSPDAGPRRDRVRICLVFRRDPSYRGRMTQFTAVVTTGIYCRPGCGAKPLPANIRTFAPPAAAGPWASRPGFGAKPVAANIRTFGSAAAAEASGYRACFQCRPYRSPQSVGWDAPELVCRAVRLILAG